MAGLGLISRRRAIASSPTAGSDYIKFADEEVFRVLLAKGVSSDGVGITKEDAAAVTDIGAWFNNNDVIVSFNELSFFTGIATMYAKSITNSAFRDCGQLQEIELPDSLIEVEGIGHETSSGGFGLFWGCTSLVKCRMSANLTKIPGCMFYNAPLEELTNIDWSRITTIGRRAINKGTLSYDTLNLSSCTEYAIGALAGVTARKVIMPLVTSLPQCNYEYDLPKGMQVLDLGENFANFPNHAIHNLKGLTLIVRATTPPTLHKNGITQVPDAIYVPDASVDAYKAAENWVNFAAKIQPLSSYSE